MTDGDLRGAPPQELMRALDELLTAAPTARAAAIAGIRSRYPAHADFIDAWLYAESIDDAPEAEAATERQIGPYTLLERISAGGFGEVFVAEQREPIQRRVALKLIKRGKESEPVLKRFLRERQILASFDHPAIAKVFDGGITPSRRPYFIMEYVEGGKPITTYCDEHHLSIHERIRLFQEVCRGVQHSHQRGILHRDLKPSNILVRRDGDRHVPKIIDFGIAKDTLRTHAGGPTVHTAQREFLGTYEYAAPEQAAGESGLTTAVDVYALGVVLYELLTGRLPFSGDDLRAKAREEVVRVLREEEPKKPSTKISELVTATGAAEQAAQCRRLRSPSAWVSTVRGDLDLVTMMALRKEPDRRYPSASEFAGDLQRYLDDAPVVARPASLGYRARKFVSRHRVQTAAVALVFAAIVTGGFVSLRFWRESEAQRHVADRAATTAQNAARDAETQRAEAERQRARAQRERDQFERVATFMGDTLAGAGPSVALGRDTTMLREMMDAAAKRIDGGELRDAPDAELHLRNTIGSTYLELAEYERAQHSLERALELARARDDDPNVALSLNNLATLVQERGDLAGAERLYREALAIRRRLHPDDDSSVAATLLNLGALLHARGDLDGAEADLRESLAISRRLAAGNSTAGDSATLQGALSDLGLVLVDRGQLEAAELLLEESLAMSRRLAPEGSRSVAACLSCLAEVHMDRGDFTAAEPLYREALAMSRKLFPGDRPEVVRGLSNLAGLLQSRGAVAAAEPLYREALDMCRRLYPGDHQDVATMLSNLGCLQQARGDLPAAERLMRESLLMTRRLFPGDHQDVAAGLNNLGGLLVARGDLAGAELSLREALEMDGRLVPADHPEGAGVRCNLAGVLSKRGDLATAEALLREALAMYRRLFGDDNPHVATTLGKLGILLHERGDPAAAVPLLQEALALDRHLWPRGDREVAVTLNNLARALQASGNLAAAEDAFREAVTVTKQVVAPDGPDLALCLDNLAWLRLDRGDLDGAETTFREALAACEGLPRPQPDLAVRARCGLGSALTRLGRRDQARDVLDAAARALPTEGVSRVSKVRCMEALAALYEAWEEAEPGKGNGAAAADWRARAKDLTGK